MRHSPGSVRDKADGLITCASSLAARLRQAIEAVGEAGSAEEMLKAQKELAALTNGFKEMSSNLYELWGTVGKLRAELEHKEFDRYLSEKDKDV